MRIRILTLLGALVLAVGLSLAGCRGGGNADDPTIDPTTGQRRQVRHFCPQHPSVVSMVPDKCRVCGNLLVPER